MPRLQVPVKNEKENQGELLERQKEYWRDKVMKAQWIKFQGEYDQWTPRVNYKQQQPPKRKKKVANELEEMETKNKVPD